MKTQINMNTFHEMLQDEAAQDQLMMVFKKLSEISEPKSITETQGLKPLGSWSGWSF